MHFVHTIGLFCFLCTFLSTYGCGSSGGNKPDPVAEDPGQATVSLSLDSKAITDITTVELEITG